MTYLHALISEKETKEKKMLPFSTSLIIQESAGLYSCYLLIQAGINLKAKKPCFNSFCDYVILGVSLKKGQEISDKMAVVELCLHHGQAWRK